MTATFSILVRSPSTEPTHRPMWSACLTVRAKRWPSAVQLTPWTSASFGRSSGRLGAALDLDEARGGGPVPPVDVVDRRIHPHAGQLVHGRRQLGEWWIGDGIGQQQVLTRRCGPHPWKLGSVEDLHHLLGRSLPPGRRLRGAISCLGNRSNRQRHSDERGQDTEHGSPPRFMTHCSRCLATRPFSDWYQFGAFRLSICDANVAYPRRCQATFPKPRDATGPRQREPAFIDAI